MREFHQQRLTPIVHRVVEKTNQSLLIDFMHAYMTCALWAELDNSDPENGGEPLDANYTLADISRKTYTHMAVECAEFLAKAEPIMRGLDMNAVFTAGDGQVYNHWEMAGHDFWLTRNGHGTGFWDREELYTAQRAKRLTALAKDFGTATLEVGDDKKIHQL